MGLDVHFSPIREVFSFKFISFPFSSTGIPIIQILFLLIDVLEVFFTLFIFLSFLLLRLDNFKYLLNYWFFLLHGESSCEPLYCILPLIIVFFSSRVFVFLCFWSCFLVEIILFMHCFPNFVLLPDCSCSSINFFKRIILNLWQFTDLHFFRVNYWSCISFLWCCHISQIFYDPWFLALVSSCVSGLLI